ncbi:MAG: hypothetical protein LBJ96_03825 [Holosporaceae bacterium]|jgi:hypothetical protein|nr:hypothetical protein [Holosporaceae bacterium]
MVTLTDLFQAKQKEMAALMDTELSHPGAQGDNTEASWINFFKQYLPNRYSCDKAFVIDSKGDISEQLDIVIYDAHFSPFFFDHGSNKYIPAESVYAVFEVKPELNKNNFEYAQQKAASVRKLFRTSAPVLCNGEERPGREVFSIIGGLLTIRNEWKSKLTEQIVDINDGDFLNIGCCIHDRSWICKKDLNNTYRYIWSKESSLLSFFMTFLNELQIRGTVPAMEISEYFDGFK